MQTTREIAARLRNLSIARRQIEDEEAQLKQLLLETYPDMENGIAPPFIKVSLRETVSLDQDAAQSFFVKHKDLRPLFSLSLKKADFDRIGGKKLGTIKTSVVIQPDTKALDRSQDPVQTAISHAA
jgi:hypothetical protein